MALPDYTTQDAATYKANIDATAAAHDALMPDVKLVNDTEIVLSSDASASFTIPSGVKRISLMFDSVVIGSGSFIYLRLGDSGGVENSNYFYGYSWITSASAADAVTSNGDTSFVICPGKSLGTGVKWVGELTLTLMYGTTWVCSGLVTNILDSYVVSFAGKKALTTELTTIQLTPSSGSLTSGTINVQYDG